MKTIRALLVDDHAIVRQGYRRLLQGCSDVVVVGEAASGADAYRLFCAHSPDVVVMDISMPGMSGIEVMRRMLAREPHARVLMFSMHEEVVFARRALRAGARGYITKASAPEVLTRAMRVVAEGGRYVSDDIDHDLQEVRTGRDAVLTGREFEVLRLLAQGRSLEDVGETLGMSAKTVANHQSAIKDKLGARTATQLVLAAMRLGLVDRAMVESTSDRE